MRHLGYRRAASVKSSWPADLIEPFSHQAMTDRPGSDLVVKITKTLRACRSLRNRIIGWVRRSDEARTGASRPSSSIDSCTIDGHCRWPRSLSRVRPLTKPCSTRRIDGLSADEASSLSFRCSEAIAIKAALFQRRWRCPVDTAAEVLFLVESLFQ